MQKHAARTINLEYGYPTVDEALKRFRNEISTAQRTGEKILKIIHGWGSTTGKSKIKNALRKELEVYRSKRYIAGYACGENFGTFDGVSQRIFIACPSIVNDSDYNKYNPGITVVLLTD